MCVRFNVDSHHVSGVIVDWGVLQTHILALSPAMYEKALAGYISISWLKRIRFKFLLTLWTSQNRREKSFHDLVYENIDVYVLGHYANDE